MVCYFLSIKDRVGRHQNICATYEVYEDEYLGYVVMDLMRGADLFDRISKVIQHNTYWMYVCIYWFVYVKYILFDCSEVISVKRMLLIL